MMASVDGMLDKKNSKYKENDKMKQDEGLSNVESCTVGDLEHLTTRHETKRNIKSRHAQMIAIGGSVGTALFVGSGQALAVGGPAFLFLSYCLMSLLVYGIATAVIEVATYLPIPGSSMSSYATRYVSPSVGFALGWLYFYSFGILVAYEITAAGIVINYWPNDVHIAVWITILLVVIVGLNLSPVAVFAETEFWFAGVKVVMIIGLLILSLVLMLGGGPTHDRLGFRYWNDPGAVNSYLIGGAGGRFTAFLYVWIFSGFSYYFSPELIVVTGGEMRNPRKNLPIASRRFFYRLAIFYGLGSLAIGIICSSTSKGLTSGAGNANASPWVIAISNAKISVLPSVVNGGILTSAWSAGNTYLYMSSRSLYSLAVSGNAPKIFTRCTKYGLPIYAVLAACCFAPLAYLSVANQAGIVFNWLVNLTNTAGYTSWLICTVILVRFRKACDAQGVAAPYRSKIQPYAAWICMVFMAFLLLANGFTVFYPGRFTTAGLLTTYLGIPVFFVLWLGHQLVAGKGQWLYRADEVDLSSGLSNIEAEATMWAEEERDKGQKRRELRWWKSIGYIWQ